MERLLIGHGGWVAFRNDDVPDWAFMKATESPSGRLIITKLCLRDIDGLNTTLLRQLPLGHLEAAFNGPEREALLSSLDELELDPVAPEKNFEGIESPIRRAAIGKLIEFGLSGEEAEKMLRPAVSEGERLRRAKVRIPSKRPYPPGFYQRVANKYGWLASASNRPAAEMAQANEVPVSTVHRWVKEARRRGLLPGGQRGKAG